MCCFTYSFCFTLLLENSPGTQRGCKSSLGQPAAQAQCRTVCGVHSICVTRATPTTTRAPLPVNPPPPLALLTPPPPPHPTPPPLFLLLSRPLPLTAAHRCNWQVNASGNVVYDSHVAQAEHVTDYRTWVSGVTAEHLVGAPSLAAVQADVAALLKGRTLVGHGLSKDLRVLMLSHPRKDIRDTAKCARRHGRMCLLACLQHIHIPHLLQPPSCAPLCGRQRISQHEPSKALAGCPPCMQVPTLYVQPWWKAPAARAAAPGRPGARHCHPGWLPQLCRRRTCCAVPLSEAFGYVGARPSLAWRNAQSAYGESRCRGLFKQRLQAQAGRCSTKGSGFT